ncbi:MAG: hypothetical protein KAS07_03400 [Candidatus Pacebacteria bacterium]|nr:hypothetical protein [Candidatus Paceibacterota bacterium]
MKIRFFLATAIGFFVVPCFSYAAQIYFDPPSRDVNYGDIFILNIRLDNEGECVNAAEVTIQYDKDIIEAVDFSRGESLITLWVDPPVIDPTSGEVSFSGGIPGGYCGRIVGDPGLSNLLGKIIFSTTGNQISSNPGVIAEISISEKTKVLINDGVGTQADLQTQNAYITVLEAKNFVVNEWTSQILEDTIPPEPFEVRVHQDANVEKGQYFIVFTTLDKQSGIDHFEVFESSLENPGYEVGTNKPAQWRVISENEQYYVLKDQTFKSKVIVKAIDKANNEQIAELDVKNVSNLKNFGTIERVFIVTTGIGIFVVLFGVALVVHRRKNEQNNSTYEDTATE